MGSWLYKSYLIVARPDYESGTSEWKPWATVCWHDNDHQHLHQIQFIHEKFHTRPATEEYALKAAEKWVDQQLGV